VRSGGGDLPPAWNTGYRCASVQAATGRPQPSQNLLPGSSGAPQRAQGPAAASRRPQDEQKTASGSGRGPQVLQAGVAAGPGV
jgi:hypothetical protein